MQEWPSPTNIIINFTEGNELSLARNHELKYLFPVLLLVLFIS